MQCKRLTNYTSMINYSNLNCHELAGLIEKKDRDAFLFIYDKYAPGIYGIILRKVQHPVDAEEILYQTFLVYYYYGLESFCFHQSIFTCLYNTVENVLKSKSMMYIVRRKEENSFPGFFLKNSNN